MKKYPLKAYRITDKTHQKLKDLKGNYKTWEKFFKELINKINA